MKRVVCLSGKYYGYDISDLDPYELIKDIEGFTDQRDPVILVNDFEDVESLGIDVFKITIIEK